MIIDSSIIEMDSTINRTNRVGQKPNWKLHFSHFWVSQTITALLVWVSVS